MCITLVKGFVTSCSLAFLLKRRGTIPEFVHSRIVNGLNGGNDWKIRGAENTPGVMLFLCEMMLPSDVILFHPLALI